MKITKLSLWSLPLTSHQTYFMAEGKTCDTVETHVLCLETDTGLKGWGEVCPIPHYLPAFAKGVPSAVRVIQRTNLVWGFFCQLRFSVHVFPSPVSSPKCNTQPWSQ